MKTLQFVYSRSFPEIYSLIDKCGIDLKGESLLAFKVWMDKKKFPVEKQNSEPQPAEAVDNEKFKVKDENASKKLEQKKIKIKELAEKNKGLKESSKKKA